MTEKSARARNRLRLFPLVAATYFVVSGGPYGLEELVAPAGYKLALVALRIREPKLARRFACLAA